MSATASRIHGDPTGYAGARSGCQTCHNLIGDWHLPSMLGISSAPDAPTNPRIQRYPHVRGASEVRSILFSGGNCCVQRLAACDLSLFCAYRYPHPISSGGKTLQVANASTFSKFRVSSVHNFGKISNEPPWQLNITCKSHGVCASQLNPHLHTRFSLRQSQMEQ